MKHANCLEVAEYPKDPCEDWWYSGNHPYIWKMASQRCHSMFCICLPEATVQVALMYHPFWLYCSFDDCSVCLKEDIIKGSCVLSSGSMLSFDPVTNVDEYSTITLGGILIDYP